MNDISAHGRLPLPGHPGRALPAVGCHIAMLRTQQAPQISPAPLVDASSFDHDGTISRNYQNHHLGSPRSASSAPLASAVGGSAGLERQHSKQRRFRWSNQTSAGGVSHALVPGALDQSGNQEGVRP